MNDTPPGIQVISRAAAILRAVAAVDGIRLTDLADTVDLPKSTAHRLVAALAEEDLLVVGSDNEIRLGATAAALGRAAHPDVVELLRPTLVDLHRELDETVDLSILDGDAVRFVDQIQSGQRLRAVSAVGMTFPLHTTANGKALLAAMPIEQADELIRALPAATRRRLRDELDEVRASDVAYDREEHTTGISAVGAVVNGPGGPLAAISVPVPAERFARSERRIRAALRRAVAAAEQGLLLR